MVNIAPIIIDEVNVVFDFETRSLFDPGHPEVIGCTEGVARYAALILWFVYNLITVTVLLNLLIAVMNASMSSVQANTIDAWKFVRTQVWLSYCNRQVSGSFLLPYKISLSQDSNPDQDPKL